VVSYPVRGHPVVHFDQPAPASSLASPPRPGPSPSLCRSSTTKRPTSTLRPPPRRRSHSRSPERRQVSAISRGAGVDPPISAVGGRFGQPDWAASSQRLSVLVWAEWHLVVVRPLGANLARQRIRCNSRSLAVDQKRLSHGLTGDRPRCAPTGGSIHETLPSLWIHPLP
jgi:hypothetical protein